MASLLLNEKFSQDSWLNFSLRSNDIIGTSFHVERLIDKSLKNGRPVDLVELRILMLFWSSDGFFSKKGKFPKNGNLMISNKKKSIKELH